MQLIWMPNAEQDYLDTLVYWYKHNGSFSYSDKIDKEVKQLEEELSENPYSLAKYYEKENLYRRTILKGCFFIYYEVLEQEEVVHILHFKSSKQRPIV